MGIVEDIERRRQVDVAAIERELTELWQVAAEAKEGDATAAVMRVCLLNLLVLITDEAHFGAVSEVVAKVTESAPCRAIIMHANPAGPEAETHAWIASHCHLDDHMRQVCCEEIRVSVGGSAVKYLARTVAPLIVPDLPVFLWWRDIQTLREKYFADFLPDVDRVIVDSRGLTHRDSLAVQLAKFVLETQRRAAFSDLNWTRLTRWRDLIAGLFDAPDLTHYLNELTRVTIRYAKDAEAPGLPLQTLLLAGFFAAQLNWTLRDAYEISPHQAELRFRAHRRRVMLTIEPQPDSRLPQRELTEVLLIAERPEPARFSVVCQLSEGADLLYITSVDITGGARHHTTITLPPLTDARLMSREVEIFGRSKPYERALRMALEMMTELELDAQSE
ncbi:MAG: glucose-6-phosphate dehydrogenase assembly protein OpcA [Chloracidobacterium sp.]|nr:glucose-6-phosphate dehydrogenase assembly protein OpcA [Chloracidobacterium sp.]MDW8217003.1 glucose-6-phosphate dehydrogenase assembly protein OpcA [Acidobacteriota bacterium]